MLKPGAAKCGIFSYFYFLKISIMKIKFISHKVYPQFQVYNEDKIVIHIKIDTSINAFRITCRENKRVFFIANEMVKKTNITTLSNEYNQQLGSLIKSKTDHNMGEIEIEGSAYTYMLNKDFSPEINLFEHNNYQPILTCKLESQQFSFLNDDYISYLLFSLAWFKFLTREVPAFAHAAEE
jgi:hypothetical protein